jgi:hypothetical protein
MWEMLAERYLRWCVFGYGMESAGFTELKNEVNRVRNCVIQYDELVELVKQQMAEHSNCCGQDSN